MNICVYGASSDNLEKSYFEAAYELGKMMAQKGHTLVFGGGNGGLMGAVARGVYDNGGRIIGIAPRFFDEPGVLFKQCSEFIYTDDMRQRKGLMEEKSEAFIALPGGIGTYEEFFEMLTLKQLGRHSKPMVLLNTNGYYDPLMTMLENTAQQGFMSQTCMGIFALCETAAEAVEAAMRLEDVGGSIRRFQDYNR